MLPLFWQELPLPTEDPSTLMKENSDETNLIFGVAFHFLPISFHFFESSVTAYRDNFADFRTEREVNEDRVLELLRDFDFCLLPQAGRSLSRGQGYKAALLQ